MPIKGPKIRIEFKKEGCKVIFTSAIKVKNIIYNNESKLLPNSCPNVYELSCDFWGEYIGETKNGYSLNQLNTKKIAWHENGKRRVQLNFPKIVMGGLIGCNQKRFRSYPTYTIAKRRIFRNK